MKILLFSILLVTIPLGSHAYYQAEQGRWISRDPIGEQGGIDPYAMVGNAPCDDYDILGNRPAGRRGATPSRRERERRERQRERHRNRNQNNRCPEQEPGSSDDSNSCPEPGAVVTDSEGGEWRYEGQPDLHGGQNTYRGMGDNSGSQCSYDENGNLDDESSGMGTADFVDPYGGDGEFNFPQDVDNVLGHVLEDVLPHLGDDNYEPGLTTRF